MKDSTLLSILPDDERSDLERALLRLDEGNLDSASLRFEYILNNSYSEYSKYSKAFAYYGLGLVHSKRTLDKLDDNKDIDLSIGYLEKSLEILEHADAHMIYATILQKKYAFDNSPLDSLNAIDRRLDMINKIIKSLTRAGDLNKSYEPMAKKDLDDIELEKQRLISARSRFAFEQN